MLAKSLRTVGGVSIAAAGIGLALTAGSGVAAAAPKPNCSKANSCMTADQAQLARLQTTIKNSFDSAVGAGTSTLNTAAYQIKDAVEKAAAANLAAVQAQAQANLDAQIKHLQKRQTSLQNKFTGVLGVVSKAQSDIDEVLGGA